MNVASCSRKRPNEFATPDPAGRKNPRTEFFFVLESESEMTPSESDTESVLSIQNRSTDFAKDTSDTSSKTSRYETDFESLAGVEYEVASLASDQGPRPFDSHTSSGNDSDGWLRTGFCEDEASGCSQLADSSSPASDVDRRTDLVPLRVRDCVKCKARTNCVPFCTKCYKVRKDFFPSRPKPHKSKHSKTFSKKKCGIKGILRLPVKEMESSGASSQEMILTPEVPNMCEDLCNICYKNPKNAAFLHCRWVHIYACYECSIKIWFSSKSCPLCHGKIKSVLKVATG